MFEKIVKILEYIITIALAIILVFVDKLPDFFPKISSNQLIGIEILLLVGLLTVIWLDINGLRKYFEADMAGLRTEIETDMNEVQKKIDVSNDKMCGIYHGNLTQLLSKELREVKEIDTIRVFAATTGTIQSIVATSLYSDKNKRIDKCFIIVHQIHGNSNEANQYNTRLFQNLDSWYKLKKEGLINQLQIKIFEELPDFLPNNYHVIINDCYMISGLLGLGDNVTKVKVLEPFEIRSSSISGSNFISKYTEWFDSFWNENDNYVGEVVYAWKSNDEIEEILTTFKNKKIKYDSLPYETDVNELQALSQEIQRIVIQQYNNMSEAYTINRRMDDFWKKRCDAFYNDYILRYQKENGIKDKIKLLDIGSGSGRDLLYYNEKNQSCDGSIKLYSIELCRDLFYNLNNLVDMQIIDANILCRDMQDLSCYDDGFFDIVQHKATLIHMPIIAPGFTAHKCLEESYRVLKNGGMLYLTVREAEKSQIVLKNAGNGIGFRIFQLYSETDIIQLVKTSGFVIDHNEKFSHKRENDEKEKEVSWIEIIAHKE